MEGSLTGQKLFLKDQTLLVFETVNQQIPSTKFLIHKTTTGIRRQNKSVISLSNLFFKGKV